MLQLIPQHLRDEIKAAHLPSAGGLEAFRELGVIVYHKTKDDFSSVEGIFSLPMYRGALAKELLKKTQGPGDGFRGVYEMETRTAKGSGLPEVAATGTLTIEPIDPDASAGDDQVGTAFWVLWDFAPEPWLNQASGYADTGVRLKYVGVGIEIPGTDSPRLAAAWTNNMFARTWTYKGTEMIQYGVCGNAVPTQSSGT